MTSRSISLTSAFALTLAAGLTAGPAFAVTNLVQNGDFSTYTITANGNANGGMVNYGANVANWSVPTPGTSYSFLFTSVSGAQLGAPSTSGNPSGQGVDGLALWGPSNGSNNGLTASPTGGAFIGQDGSYQAGALSQTISGLTPGQTYQLSFYWAAAQQEGFSGGNTQWWQVSLGGQSESTQHLTITSEGFNGWDLATMTFTASSASELLSFLAMSNATSSLPPFTLLDDVQLNQVPEPSTWAMMLLGFVGLGYASFRSQRRRAAAAIA
jgi:hypothetical protein